MQKLSIVIICRNESAIIESTLGNLIGITDDIILYDNGSNDGTPGIARRFDVHVHEGPWEGFGNTKNKANQLAKYDWILSLDADERIDDELKKSLAQFDPKDESTVYDLRFKNFLGDKLLRFGEWGNDDHIRLFNRRKVSWNNEAVHETLLYPPGYSVKRLKGFILHQTMKDLQEYAQKTVRYAMLSADKYFKQGKRPSWFKIQLSPGFNFLNYYILKLGFLDGHAGYICARMTAHYTFLKYARLLELWRQQYGGIEKRG
jgi:glycosyltransferase involved in cell wall biosynthesis